LQFEKAALLRDQIKELKRMLEGQPPENPKPVSYRKPGRRSAGGPPASAQAGARSTESRGRSRKG
jgi:hypothetical protein